MRTLVGLLCLFAVSAARAADPVSGLRVGDEVSAWEPVHVAGPHAGTKTCPVCTYLDAPVVLAFAKDAAAAAKLAKPLEVIAAAHRQGTLKVMLVVVDASDDQLRAIAKDAGVKSLMLCRPDPAKKAKQLQAYKIDPTVSNSVVLYQNYTVKKAWAELDAVGLAKVITAAAEYLPKR